MRTVLICGLAVVTFGLGACGGDDDEDGRVVATTSIAADIARQVAGPDIEVAQLFPDGADPHEFAPAPQDRERLEQAELVVAMGAGLEGGADLGPAGDRFELADHVDLRGRNPHFWMDPSLVRRALPALAEALARINSGARDGFRKRARRLSQRLIRLDREIAGRLSRVPRRHRLLVTSHATLSYFGAAYGFRTASVHGSSPEAEPRATRLAELGARIRRRRLPAVFAERGETDRALSEVAGEGGARVVRGLLVESLGDRSYQEALRLDARLIAEGLSEG